MDKPAFSELSLSPEILKAVAALGFEQASPIQAAAIPILLSGVDVVGQSQTGSGKTAAFAIPAIEAVDAGSREVQALILCPTRELATQVADEVHKLSAFKKGIHAVPIYGGASYDRQFYELNKGVQIVIGTPGRLIDHLQRGTLKLNSIKMLILDEADRMLDMGFREDIEKILDAAPEERQTVFFSATVSKPIRDLINRFSKDPQFVKIEQKEVSAPAIEQWFFETNPRMKLDALNRLVDFHDFKLGIIFCNTQRMVDELADALIARGFSADRLHGGIAQAQRTRVMNKFKKAEFEFLVATDVAARGIDVEELELVVNYDLPYDAEDYVHRIGRTGRAGKKGMAVTFVSGREIYKLQFIERFTRTKIRRGTIPTRGEVEEKRTDAMLENVRATLVANELQPGTALVDRLLGEGFNSTDIAGAALQLLLGTSPEPAGKPEERREETSRPPRSEPRSFESRSSEPRPPERTRPPAEPRKPRDDSRPAFKAEPGEDTRPTRMDAAPVLRKPATGMQWVALNIGRDDSVTPRDIVDMVSNGLGIPGKSVGTIELSRGESFAEIPTSFAKGSPASDADLAWHGKSVRIRPIRVSGGAGGGSGKPEKRFGKPPGAKKKWDR